MDWLFPAAAGALALAALASLIDPDGKKRWPNWSAMLLCILGVILLGRHFWPYLVDDAYISLRYGRNLAEGYGLTYDTSGGDRVEGFTNLLWVLVEAPLFLILPDQAVVGAVKWLGLAAMVGALAIVLWTTSAETGSRRAGVLTALAIAAIPGFAFWAIGGLETGLYLVLLAGTIGSWLAAERQGRSPWLPAAGLVLLALTRTDGLVLSLALGAVGYVHGRRTPFRGQTRNVLLGAAALYAGYFFLRYQYYDYLFPNTVYAKTAGPTWASLSSRVAGIVPLAVVLLPGMVFGLLHLARRRGLLEKFLVAGFLSTASVAMAIQREWMPGHRYELPAAFCLAWLGALGFQYLLKGGESSPPYWARAGIVLFVCLVPLVLAPGLARETAYGPELEGSHESVGHWMRGSVPQADSWAGLDMGAIPFYSRVNQVIELNPEGLLSNDISHHGYNVSRIMSQRPDVIFIPSDNGDRSGFRAIYADPVFVEEYEALAQFSFLSDHYVVHAREDLGLSAQAREDLLRRAQASES